MPEDRRSVLSYVFWIPLAMIWSCFLLCYAIHIRRGRRRTGIASRSERNEEEERDTTYNKKEKQSRRRKALLEIFEQQHIHKTLSMDDFFIPKTITDPPAVVDAITSQSTIAVDLENGRGTIGTDEDHAETTTTRMIKLPRWDSAAPNGCAICLCEYQPGDILVWSSNRSSCRHVYHQDCLLEYFLTKGGGCADEHSNVTTIPPCPMCRQAFIVLQTEN